MFREATVGELRLGKIAFCFYWAVCFFTIRNAENFARDEWWHL